MRKGGCWIFLSHSSKDIIKVRQIRNEFEKMGHNPLAFHLLCLNADSEEGKKELDSLIKREIDAREWFVSCESDAARQSEYVAMEKEYIVSCGKKKIWSIDMNLPVTEILEQVDNICRQIKVFISYAHKDQQLIGLLEDELVRMDFDVWTDHDLRAGEQWNEAIKNNILKASEYGIIILFITEHYLKSKYTEYELLQIFKSGANIIPLIIGDISIPAHLKKYHCYQIPDEISADNMHLIAELVQAETRKQIKGPMCQADAWTKISQINETFNSEKKYHPLEAELIAQLGPWDDYCEVYRFPCCGKIVRVGDGPVSRFRNDGCCKS